MANPRRPSTLNSQPSTPLRFLRLRPVERGLIFLSRQAICLRSAKILPTSVSEPDASSGRGLCTAFHALVVGGSFLVAAAGAALFIEPRLPSPSVPDIGARLQYYAEHKEDYDTVFIGSSRFRHHIIPHEFDLATTAGRVPTHSFNLGYSGMWPPESFYFLREVLALHPKKLHWIFIELMDYRFGEWENKPLTMRSVYWHDRQHTAMILRVMAESPLPLGEKCRQLATHLKLFVRRMLNPGSAADWLENRYFPTKSHSKPDWVARAGFDPEEQGGAWTPAASAELAEQVEAVKRSLPPQPLRPGFSAAFQDLLGDLHRAAVQPIFIISPTVRPAENLALGLPADLTIFRFNQPEIYPRLYVPETHYNIGHLNEAGAHEFTRLLAQGFVEHETQR
jgi:hypothetical protein